MAGPTLACKGLLTYYCVQQHLFSKCLGPDTDFFKVGQQYGAVLFHVVGLGLPCSNFHYVLVCL